METVANNSSTPKRVRRQRQIEPFGLRVRDAVLVSGVSKSRLYEWIKSGEIESDLIEGMRIIRTESLKRKISGGSES